MSFLTGFFDKDGYLYITGRSKNLIVLKSGKKVHTEEVEAVLQQSRLVKEAAVFANKNGEDETIAALIVLANPNISEQEALLDLRLLRNQLSDYKWPSRIKFQYKDLPKTSTQKIKKLEVEKLFRTNS